MNKVISTGLVLGAALSLIGCGGSSEGDGLPKATGKLKKSEAVEAVYFVANSNLNGYKIFLDEYGIGQPAPKVAKKIENNMKVMQRMDKVSDNTYFIPCGHEGNRTIRVISGIPHNDPVTREVIMETKASKYVFEETFNNCSYDPRITMNGVISRIQDWKRDGKGGWYSKWSGEKKNFVYKIDDENLYTDTASWSGITDELWKEGAPVKKNNTSHSVHNGKIILGDRTIELKNITKDITEKENQKNSTGSKTMSVSGALKDSEIGGWLVVRTPVTFEKNQNDKVVVGEEEDYCYHIGKMTISGADHVITTEVHADHSIDVKYDDKVVMEYENCIKFDNKEGTAVDEGTGGSGEEANTEITEDDLRAAIIGKMLYKAKKNCKDGTVTLKQLDIGESTLDYIKNDEIEGDDLSFTISGIVFEIPAGKKYLTAMEITNEYVKFRDGHGQSTETWYFTESYAKSHAVEDDSCMQKNADGTYIVTMKNLEGKNFYKQSQADDGTPDYHKYTIEDGKLIWSRAAHGNIVVRKDIGLSIDEKGRIITVRTDVKSYGKRIRTHTYTLAKIVDGEWRLARARLETKAGKITKNQEADFDHLQFWSLTKPKGFPADL